MITRKIGKLLRGDATPFQLFSACILAAVLGFMPGFAQAPGLLILFTLLIIVLNANLVLAAFVGMGAKLLSLLIAPITFSFGRFLLDGPTQSLFQNLINAPVFALFGFDYYLTTGGLVMGIIVGVIVGFLAVRAITAYRKKMAALEKDSEKFKNFTAKGWVKFLTFIFVGGKRKKTYEETMAKKVGNPIRPLGAVFAVLVLVLLFILQMFAAGPIVTYALQRGLEEANGATVDVEEADLSLKENRLTVKGLAMADPNQLDTDLFRAASLEADISGMNLLKKRLQLDRVVFNDASHGEKRTSPGSIIGKPPQPTSEAPSDPNVKTIDDYIKQAKVWKERLAQVKEWMEKLSGPEADQPGVPAEEKETLEERLQREIREKGYANVRASHLIEGAPTLTISELVAEKVKLADLENETLDITATNLSTHPNLLGKTPRVVIRSSADTLGANLVLGMFGDTASSNLLSFFYKGLATDKIASSLKVGGEQPIQGGTMDIDAQGQWFTAGGVTVDLPLKVALHNATISLPGGQPTQVENFLLPIGVRGPLDNPRISIDDKQLANALVQAGISRAKQELTNQAKEKISGEVGDKLGEKGKGLLNNLLGGDKKDE